MSGHSKWSTIKRKKGAADAKRGQVFTRLIREITVAAKFGGGDPDGNPRLRTAIDAAKAENMPKDNIDRAIKKGTGELEGVSYEEITYEAYAPGGVALLIEVMTDNKNRTAADVRHILNKRGGSLAKAGSVGYLFEGKGVFTLDKSSADEDKLMEVALEAGAEDVKDEGDVWEVHCAPTDFNALSDALTQAGLKPSASEVTKLPSTTVAVTDPAEASRVIKLMDALDECDDIQQVYANFDIDDQLLASLED
jgi:YebC/PmpR family DNA-binding regulatory protein